MPSHAWAIGKTFFLYFNTFKGLLVIHNLPCKHSSRLQLSIWFTPSRCLDVRQDWNPMQKGWTIPLIGCWLFKNMWQYISHTRHLQPRSIHMSENDPNRIFSLFHSNANERGYVGWRWSFKITRRCIGAQLLAASWPGHVVLFSVKCQIKFTECGSENVKIIANRLLNQPPNPKISRNKKKRRGFFLCRRKRPRTRRLMTVYGTPPRE